MADFELLLSGRSLIEGPRVDADGNLYFSDVHNGGVYRRRPDGTVETAVPKRRGVGGIALHADGGLVVGGRNVQHVKDGRIRVLFDPEDANGINDLFTDSAGRVYTGTLRSDPFSEGGERLAGDCWRIEGEGIASRLYGDVGLTNGIGFSPDESVIYHSDTARNHVIAHDIVDGRCVNRRAFATLERGGPDGLAVDQDGGLWVAAYGGGCITHFDAAGRLVEHLEVPATAVTSVCFGAADLRDLYVATADHADPSLGGCILRTRAPVAGLPAPPARI
ncbi:MAG: SMP-30/gluconolactonase/LRE family protein [Dehalococcoidia bacterium]